MVRPLASPASISSSCFRRRIDWEMVFQLVSVPPSQRWLMKYCAERLAASAIPSDAWRLVPTNSTRPPPATTSLILTSAWCSSGTDWARSMMWMLLRAPKMKGAIFGFQRWLWWPKWQPASSS